MCVNRLGPEEQHWEAPLPSQGVSEDHIMDITEDDESEDPLVTRGRETIERSLRQQVYVDRFPLASAGAPLQASPQSTCHPDARSDSNPYAPFKSRMDWEIARWAKLRGPGSTAITELLSISGVCSTLLICMLTSF